MRWMLAALALIALMSAIGAALSGKLIGAAGFSLAFASLCYLLVAYIARDEEDQK